MVSEPSNSSARWPSDLSARHERGLVALQDCRLCSRDCGVDRTKDAEGAWCKLGVDAYAYKELLSHGEESCIGPTWLIDLSGCSLRCLFCTEWHHVTEPRAKPAVPLRASWFLRRLAHHTSKGARSISFVGGEPTVNLAGVLAVLAEVPEAARLPIVWNTNGLIGTQALALLHGLVTTWLVDLKVHTAPAANRLLGARALPYGAAVHALLDTVHPDEAPAKYALPSLLIRHLLMPGALETETLPILREIAARWPNAVVNLMTMYLPYGPALRELRTAPELRQMVPSEDRATAIAEAETLGLHLLVDGQPRT